MTENSVLREVAQQFVDEIVGVREPNSLAAVAEAWVTAVSHEGLGRGRGQDTVVDLFPTISDHVGAVNRGEAVLAKIGTVKLFAGVEQGMPIRMIAVVHGHASAENYGVYSIVARSGAGIEIGEIAALKGKRIGVPLGTDGDGALRAFLKSVGLTYADVEIVNLLPRDGVAILREGRVDAMCAQVPRAARALVEVAGSVRVTTTDPPTYQPGVLISTSSFIEANRPLLRDVLVAMARLYHWTRNHRDEMIAIVERHVSRTDVAIAKETLSRVGLDMRLSKLVLRGLKDKTIPDLVNLGLIQQPFDPANAVDASLMVEVQATYPELFADLPTIPAGAQLA